MTWNDFGAAPKRLYIYSKFSTKVVNDDILA
jgi:hypothetical protein